MLRPFGGGTQGVERERERDRERGGGGGASVRATQNAEGLHVFSLSRNKQKHGVGSSHLLLDQLHRVLAQVADVRLAAGKPEPHGVVRHPHERQLIGTHRADQSVCEEGSKTSFG